MLISLSSVPAPVPLLAGLGAASGISAERDIDVLPDGVLRWFFTSDLLMRLMKVQSTGCA